MFDALNLLYLGVVVSGLNLVLYSDGVSYFPQKNEVTQVSFHREWWREDSACHFTGLMVPFARDWEDVQNNGVTETKLPADPEKIVGYAFVINKKSCPGKPDEALFNTDETDIRKAGQWRDASAILGKYMIYTVSMAGKPASEQPKWLPQVMKTIGNAATTNPAAKDFLDFSRQAADAAKAANKESLQPAAQ